jgi:hypothetical protein
MLTKFIAGIASFQHKYIFDFLKVVTVKTQGWQL